MDHSMEITDFDEIDARKELVEQHQLDYLPPPRC